MEIRKSSVTTFSKEYSYLDIDGNEIKDKVKIVLTVNEDGSFIFNQMPTRPEINQFDKFFYEHKALAELRIEIFKYLINENRQSNIQNS